MSDTVFNKLGKEVYHPYLTKRNLDVTLKKKISGFVLNKYFQQYNNKNAKFSYICGKSAFFLFK